MKDLKIFLVDSFEAEINFLNLSHKNEALPFLKPVQISFSQNRIVCIFYFII